jgi:Putative transposase/Transposase zinc-binding domain
MAQGEQGAKNVFKQIFSDGWTAFLERHPRYATVDEVVQKMLGCGDAARGHAVYLCPDCLERHVVAFSCKSPFCLSCAKVYGQNWVETVQEMLHPGVKYRHLVLTVPEALRTLIYRHAVPLLEGLMQAARTAIDAVVRQAKRQTVLLGYIVVLQTAGRSATYNPHLHVLMTDGGLRAEGAWQPLGYVPYDLLHRVWQEQVLALITTRLPGDAEAERLVVALRRRYPRGFVAHLQGDVLPRMKQLTRYLVKYVVSPPLALSRIVAYDRVHGTVTYWYRDHLSQGKRTVETVDRTTFIGRMVQHILPKGFQRIRYYGLQATCTLAKMRQKVVAAVQGAVQQVIAGLGAQRRRRYRERMQATLGRDPLRCPRCGTALWLWRIWHPRYGLLYDELEQMKQRGGVLLHERSPGPAPGRDRAGDARPRDAGYISVPLFPLPA